MILRAHLRAPRVGGATVTTRPPPSFAHLAPPRGDLSRHSPTGDGGSSGNYPRSGVVGDVHRSTPCRYVAGEPTRFPSSPLTRLAPSLCQRPPSRPLSCHNPSLRRSRSGPSDRRKNGVASGHFLLPGTVLRTGSRALIPTRARRKKGKAVSVRCTDFDSVCHAHPPPSRHALPPEVSERRSVPESPKEA